MCDAHQRAGGLRYVESSLAHMPYCFFGSAVRGDHHVLGTHRGDVLRDPHTPSAQLRQDSFIVDQVAQHRQRPGRRLLQGQLDGVADAKTHA